MELVNFFMCDQATMGMICCLAQPCPLAYLGKVTQANLARWGRARVSKDASFPSNLVRQGRAREPNMLYVTERACSCPALTYLLCSLKMSAFRYVRISLMFGHACRYSFNDPIKSVNLFLLFQQNNGKQLCVNAMMPSSPTSSTPPKKKGKPGFWSPALQALVFVTKWAQSWICFRIEISKLFDRYKMHCYIRYNFSLHSTEHEQQQIWIGVGGK